ncbi:TonB-dependent receptor [Vibrio genomosp. F6]|uniref:TonB-dependent receptor domain-containing protein n=1 Tax=Vibrio genomosp. F6 TaxID=723172 RepID=UPI0010BD00DB|nr:TonB-dependent receptor [Vibrio genomosp. F6]TKF18801.1 TonB-dependent receptor [Vibrio genomosp. F6]
MNKSLLAIAVASLLTPISYLHAQEASADETMVVTANRFEQPLNEVIASTTVITKQEIEEYQAKSLVDVLKRVPGIEVSQTGGRGQSASIFMRGYNSDHVLVLVDGVRIETSAGKVSFNHFPIGLIERVEIIKGAGGALYGSDAIAGVINIITSTQDAGERTSVNVGAGSDNQREASFSTTKKVAASGTLKLAGGFEETEGFDIKDPATGLDYGYESSNIFAGYSHQISKQWLGSLSVRWFDSLAEYDSSGKKFGYTENLSVTGEVQYQGDKLNSVFRLNQQAIDSLEYTSAEGKDGAGTKKFIDQTSAQFLNLYAINNLASLGAGADWRQEKLSDDSVGWGLDPLVGETQNTTGVYISGDIKDERFHVNASVRNDKHDKYDNYTTWSLGGAYSVAENHQVRANIGTAFKAPSYSDLSSNPDLKAEESINREIGYSGQFDLIDVDVTYYNNEADNLIIWYQGSPWYAENVDAKLKGIEISAGFDTGFIHHTIVAEYKDHKDSRGNKLAKRADENYKWLLDAYYEDVEFNLTYLYTGERLGNPDETNISGNMLPSVSLWDVSVGYWISPELVVRGKIDNLTDEKYQTSLGYNAPERRFFTNLSYQF